MCTSTNDTEHMEFDMNKSNEECAMNKSAVDMLHFEPMDYGEDSNKVGAELKEKSEFDNGLVLE